MTDETVPYEMELTGLTTAARRAISVLERPGDVWENAIEAAQVYEAENPLLGKKFNSQIILSNPDLRKQVKGEGAGKKFMELVSALVDAHLDLYSISTEKSAGGTIQILADCIRLPTLGVLQGGYICLALIDPCDTGASTPKLERLARKGRVNPSGQDIYVSQAIFLLESELELRKRPAVATAARQTTPSGTLKKEPLR